MLTNVSHAGGVENADEILFSTPFGYMFPEAAKSPDCLLPRSERTEDALLALGAAMGEPGTAPGLDSDIPAAYTYLGQFIDHDITARTDRESLISRIAQADGRALPIVPVEPEHVVAGLANGRRPQLDLDSVYGDGPGLIPGSQTEASALYDPTNKKLLVQPVSGDAMDLPRLGRKALIADMRNDENLNVSQLHGTFLAFHNKVADTVTGALTASRRYAKARQIVRWTYQYIVVHDYLMRVCAPDIIDEALRNGPRFFGPGTGGMELFMPLEFAVAGFRFGHSMIRGSYTVQTGNTLTIGAILGVSREHSNPADDLLEPVGGGFRLKAANTIHWSKYLEFPGTTPQMARKIDTRLSDGLFDLPFDSSVRLGAMMRQLAQRNLMRGYLLSLPTGQAVASAMGIVPLIEEDLTGGESPEITAAIEAGRFHRRTPLWYYMLKEAAAQTGGQSLGAVGSRLVGETLIGFLKHDPNSYLNNAHHSRVQPNGIKVPGRPQPIATLADMLDYTGLPK